MKITANDRIKRVAQRTDELHQEHRHRVYSQTDRLFVVLMALQWLGGVVMAMVVSPTTWIGDSSHTHVHVWAAFWLGGLISIGPIVMALRHPGAATTRHVIAVAQAAWSALLIHLSGGRIETHFHVFGSLAFLAFYRDWRVLITATIVVAGDHMIRGYWWPQSVYGVVLESPYRWIEHAAWVLFEDAFLVISCLRGQREGQEICQRRALLELTNEEIELRVRDRTRELEDARSQLENEFAGHRNTQKEREQLYSDLAAASRRAGMAEVATDMLHNVGNVLNSLNVSTHCLTKQLKSSHGPVLKQACDLMQQHRDDLAGFFTHDERGQKLPDFLSRLAGAIAREYDSALDELASLQGHVEHVKRVVDMQQRFARAGGVHEPVDLPSLVNEAVKINDASLSRHHVTVKRRFGETPQIMTDKHKVLQILVNIIKNAKQSVCETDREQRWIELSIDRPCESVVAVQVSDNGVGISPESLSKIFTHGFTTKQNGHGFGLHSGSLTAKELGGKLSVHSEGKGQGATFTLELPVAPVEKSLNPTKNEPSACWPTAPPTPIDCPSLG